MKYPINSFFHLFNSVFFVVKRSRDPGGLLDFFEEAVDDGIGVSVCEITNKHHFMTAVVECGVASVFSTRHILEDETVENVIAVSGGLLDELGEKRAGIFLHQLSLATAFSDITKINPTLSKMTDDDVRIIDSILATAYTPSRVASYLRSLTLALHRYYKRQGFFKAIFMSAKLDASPKMDRRYSYLKNLERRR